MTGEAWREAFARIPGAQIEEWGDALRVRLPPGPPGSLQGIVALMLVLFGLPAVLACWVGAFHLGREALSSTIPVPLPPPLLGVSLALAGVGTGIATVLVRTMGGTLPLTVIEVDGPRSIVLRAPGLGTRFRPGDIRSVASSVEREMVPDDGATPPPQLGFVDVRGLLLARRFVVLPHAVASPLARAIALWKDSAGHGAARSAPGLGCLLTWLFLLGGGAVIAIALARSLPMLEASNR